MKNNWYKKEKPFTGFAGFGGGVAGLALAGGAAAVDPDAASRYIAFPLSNGGSGSSLVINDGGTYGT